MTRKTLFQIIEPHQKENAIEKAYDVLMFLTIIVSLIPLTTKSHTGLHVVGFCVNDYFYYLLHSSASNG